MNTYKEYIKLVDQTYNTFGWRYGQTVMNVLHSVWPQKYSELVATEKDCYYDDSKTGHTLKFLEQEWNQDASMQKTTL